MKKVILAGVAMLFLGTLFLRAQSIPEIEKDIENGRLKEARAKLDKMIGADPKNERLTYLSGHVYFLEEDFARAKSAFEKGIGIAPRYAMNFVGLAAVMVKQDFFAEAQTQMVKAKDANKNQEIKPMLAMAEAWMGSDKQQYLAEAQKILTLADSKDPSNAEVKIALGDLYDRMRVEESALSNYEMAVKLNPSFVKGYIRVGQIKKRQKAYNEAAKSLERAIELDAQSAVAYYEIGDLWFLAGQPEKAKQNFEKYLSLMGNDVGAKLKYGKALFLVPNYQECVNVLEPLLADTTNLAMYRMLGYAFVELKNGDKAKKYLDLYFSKATEKSFIPSDFEYNGRLMILNGQDSLGTLEYYKAIELAKKNGEDRKDLYDALVEMYKGKKRPDKVAEVLERKLAGNYTGMKDVNDLAKAYYDLKNYVKADEVYAKLTELKPDLYVGYMWRAFTATKMDPENKEWLAVPHFTKMLEVMKPEEKTSKSEAVISANIYLGVYYMNGKSDCKTATTYFDAVLAIKPDHKDALQYKTYCKGK